MNQIIGIPSDGLISLLENGNGAFISIKKALICMESDHALAKTSGFEHSIMDILAHMNFWQNWVLDNIHGKNPPLPQEPSGGWPTFEKDDWEELYLAFLQGLEECKKIAKDPNKLGLPFIWGEKTMTIGFALLDNGMHNAYHTGQIVTLRKQLGIWPPEGRSYI